jgi:hypothetical protein
LELGVLVDHLTFVIARAAKWLYAKLGPKQCNEFAFAISKTATLQPWIDEHRHIAQEGGGFSRSGAGLGFNVAFLFWTVLSVVGDGFELFRRFPCPS